MFDFEKLEVYGKAKKLNNSISSFLGNKKIDKVAHDQLRRASFNTMQNRIKSPARQIQYAFRLNKLFAQMRLIYLFHTIALI
jgi:hypothetical protein